METGILTFQATRESGDVQGKKKWHKINKGFIRSLTKADSDDLFTGPGLGKTYFVFMTASQQSAAGAELKDNIVVVQGASPGFDIFGDPDLARRVEALPPDKIKTIRENMAEVCDDHEGFINESANRNIAGGGDFLKNRDTNPSNFKFLTPDDLAKNDTLQPAEVLEPGKTKTISDELMKELNGTVDAAAEKITEESFTEENDKDEVLDLEKASAEEIEEIINETHSYELMPENFLLKLTDWRKLDIPEASRTRDGLIQLNKEYETKNNIFDHNKVVEPKASDITVLTNSSAAVNNGPAPDFSKMEKPELQKIAKLNNLIFPDTIAKGTLMKKLSDFAKTNTVKVPQS